VQEITGLFKTARGYRPTLHAQLVLYLLERDCNLTHSGISEFLYDNDIQCHLAGQSVESVFATRGAQWTPEHLRLRRCYRRGGEIVVMGRKIVAAYLHSCASNGTVRKRVAVRVEVR
jgi:hypothetical protein